MYMNFNFLKEETEKKWGSFVDNDKFPAIKNPYVRAVTAVVLENCEDIYSKEGGGIIKLLNDGTNKAEDYRALLKETAANFSGAYPNETSPGNLKGPEPVLIPMLRQAVPQMIAFDIIGVQPLNASVGLIFALRSRATSRGGAEILFPEADTRFGTADASAAGAGFTATNPAVQADADAYKAHAAATTAEGEGLGTGGGNPEFSEIAFTIDKVTVQARTRAIKAEYTVELQQDMMTGHGLDARAELMQIMTQELLFEQNREIIRTVHNNAKSGAQFNTTTAGIFDLDTDSDGRWMEERFKGLQFQIERDANAIMLDARRGRGNWVICSADVASALSVTKLLDSDSAARELNQFGEVQGTYVGTLNGRFKVFVDPYIPASGTNYFVVGYKGASAWDAGLYFCPYVPLQMMEAVGPSDFQPRIAYKTRYGLVSNPYANSAGTGALTWNANKYFRRVNVQNLM